MAFALVAHADEALYRAKASGGDCVRQGEATEWAALSAHKRR
jgi:hypothetical protein